ncbi:MAG: hypothetical protein GY941_06915 [Planctomycetes bacterium]|nr:hypothetical protein [Planctomycetota bacterium]
MPVRKILTLLRDAGLDTIPGGGDEILTDRCRSQLSHGKRGGGIIDRVDGF